MVIMILRTIPHKYFSNWASFDTYISYLESKNRLGSVQITGKENDIFNILEVNHYSLEKLTNNWNTMWRNIISGTSNIEIISWPECGYLNVL
jgi:hypothetical protein